MLRSISILWIGLCLSTAQCFAYSGGTGEPNDPYQIATAQDLIELGNEPNDYDQCFILTADIDLDPNLPGGRIFGRAIIASDAVAYNRRERSYSIVGQPFSGNFDGNGHVIRNLSIQGRSWIGLFGTVDAMAVICNVGLEAIDVHGTGIYVGGLAGLNYGTITSTYSCGSVNAHGLVGGLVGSNYGSVILSYSSSSVSGDGSVGGLVGANDGSITSSYSTASVSGTNGHVGGLTGSNDGSITSSFSSGPVSGDIVGGLAGSNEGCITSSFSSGPVSGNIVGGLVGSNEGTITSSYSSGSIGGRRKSVAGLVGVDEGRIAASFWDIETSGLSQYNYYGWENSLTTEQMQDIETYLEAGWDFAGETHDGTCNYWVMQEGAYPSLAAFSGSLRAEPNGSGSPDDPYLLTDANDLGSVWIRPRACYRVEVDIDLSGITWNWPVVPNFAGIFDGNGHIISNLCIEGGYSLGLFGRCSDEAVISNLGLEAVDVNGIKACGGLVGINSGSITSSYSSGSVRAYYRVGGLVGVNSGNVTTSYSSGLVVGEFWDVGGLVGSNEGVIISSYSSSSVSGTADYVGGLVGYNWSDITTSYSSGSVSGDSTVGGFVGFNNGTVTSNYSHGSVSGDRSVGGLVGLNVGSITSSYNSGSASGADDYVGGLVGCNVGSITSSYNSGSVSGAEDYVGGLVGDNSGSITSSYSNGTVCGNDRVGGLVGYNHRYWLKGAIISSFWDIETSGQNTSDGGTGLTTSQMQEIDIYLNTGWDLVGETHNGTCNYWVIQKGSYPGLAAFSGSISTGPNGSGSLDDPYLLTDVNDLGSVWIRPWACYRVEADIDLRGIAWNSAVVPGFSGIFDGNGHVISNLSVEGGGCLGLFGQLRDEAVIVDLGLEVVDINGTGDYVGALVGLNVGSITSSYSSGSISGNNYVGGLVARNLFNGVITSSYSSASVSGNEYVGGLMGFNEGVIISSYSRGSVTGNDLVGGLMGSDDGLVWSCFWDIETSGQSTGSGYSCTGLTTAQMLDINTFLDVDWDFVDETANGTDDIWWMPVGDYPRLWWESQAGDLGGFD